MLACEMFAAPNYYFIAISKLIKDEISIQERKLNRDYCGLTVHSGEF